MNKYLVSLVFIIPLSLFALWMVFSSSGGTRVVSLLEEAEVPTVKVIKYRIEVSNPSNLLIDGPSLLVAVPTDLHRHKISNISISSPYKKAIDEVGNTSVDIDLIRLVPYETKLIDVTVSLDVYKRLSKNSINNTNIYTDPEKLIESNNEKLVKQASMLKADSQLESARNTYDWVVGYLSDSGFIEEDRGALYAFKHKKADCTGYMYLYGALLRANGIPARMMSGFIVETNKKLDIKDYHNWVEVYLDGVWRVVDPQNKKFLEEESNYIAMRIINNTKTGLFDNAQQLFKTNSAITLTMK